MWSCKQTSTPTARAARVGGVDLAEPLPAPSKKARAMTPKSLAADGKVSTSILAQASSIGATSPGSPSSPPQWVAAAVPSAVSASFSQHSDSDDSSDTSALLSPDSRPRSLSAESGNLQTALSRLPAPQLQSKEAGSTHSSGSDLSRTLSPVTTSPHHSVSSQTRTPGPRAARVVNVDVADPTPGHTSISTTMATAAAATGRKDPDSRRGSKPDIGGVGILSAAINTQVALVKSLYKFEKQRLWRSLSKPNTPVHSPLPDDHSPRRTLIKSKSAHRSSSRRNSLEAHRTSSPSPVSSRGLLVSSPLIPSSRRRLSSRVVPAVADVSVVDHSVVAAGARGKDRWVKTPNPSSTSSSSAAGPQTPPSTPIVAVNSIPPPAILRRPVFLLFCRLYSLQPVNFCRYLAHYCAQLQRTQQIIFATLLSPMCERMRLHPCALIGYAADLPAEEQKSEDWLSAERWLLQPVPRGWIRSQACRDSLSPTDSADDNGTPRDDSPKAVMSDAPEDSAGTESNQEDPGAQGDTDPLLETYGQLSALARQRGVQLDLDPWAKEDPMCSQVQDSQRTSQELTNMLAVAMSELVVERYLRSQSIARMNEQQQLSQRKSRAWTTSGSAGPITGYGTPLGMGTAPRDVRPTVDARAATQEINKLKKALDTAAERQSIVESRSQEQISRLHRQTKNLDSLVNGLKEQLAGAAHEVAQYQMALSQAEEELRRTARLEIELRTTSTELKSARSKIHELEQANEQLLQNLAGWENIHRTFTDRTLHLVRHEVQQQLESLRNKLARAQRREEEAEAQLYEVTKGSYATRMDELKATNKQLRTSLAFQQQNSEEEAAAQKRRYDDIVAINSQLATRVMHLEQQLRAANTAATAAPTPTHRPPPEPTTMAAAGPTAARLPALPSPEMSPGMSPELGGLAVKMVPLQGDREQITRSGVGGASNASPVAANRSLGSARQL